MDFGYDARDMHQVAARPSALLNKKRFDETATLRKSQALTPMTLTNGNGKRDD